MTMADAPTITKSTDESITVEIPMDAVPAKAVVVAQSPLAGLFRQLTRHSVIAGGALAANYFWHDGNITAEFIAIVGIVLAIGDAMFDKLKSNSVKRVLTNMLPDEMAKFK